MVTRRTSSGLLIVVALAFLGFLLVTIPPKLLEQYQALRGRHPTFVTVYLVVVGLGACLLLFSGAWIVIRLWRQSRRKRQRNELRRKNPSRLSTEEKQQEVEQNLASVKSLETDPTASPDLRRELARLRAELDAKQQRQHLEIVAFGSISSGKSSLLNLLAGREAFRTDVRGGTTIQRNEIPWTTADRVTLVDTPGLGEIEGAEHVRISTEAAKDADIVLLVVDGPLREFEFDLLQRLGEMEKRVLVCLNKADWYDPQQQQRLREQIVAQLSPLVRPEDVVPVTAQPVKRSRVRIRPDGTTVEEEVVVPADISALADRLLHVIERDGRDLLLANLLLQSRGLVADARERVRESLDARAREIIHTYMWAAGGAAAVSPLPIIDLAAGSAVTIKMVVELAKVYRQDIDLETASRLLAQLGKNLIAILGVGVATPAIVSAVGSLLKAVPGAGTIAGGALQGVVQAVITRWIGNVFMCYFRDEMQGGEQSMAELARQQWNQVTSITELRKIVQQAREQWTKGSPPHNEQLQGESQRT